MSRRMLARTASERVGHAVMTACKSVCTPGARCSCTTVCGSCSVDAAWGGSCGLCKGRNARICVVCAGACVSDASRGEPEKRGSNPVFSIRDIKGITRNPCPSFLLFTCPVQSRHTRVGCRVSYPPVGISLAPLPAAQYRGPAPPG
jgi:hypothetical protein